MSLFSETLKGLRLKAGFKSAYKFFHDSCGDPVLKMSYANYLMTERGRSLPLLSKLPALYCALGLKHDSPEAGALARAWLQTAYGEASYRWLLRPLLSEERPGSPSTARSGGADTVVYVTQKQLEAVSRDQAHYLTHLALANDAQAWTTEALAAKLGLPEEKVRQALRELKRNGILEEPARGTYRGLWAGASLHFPGSLSCGAVLRRLGALDEELAASGRVEFMKKGILLVDTARLGEFFKLISLCLENCNLYAKTTGSARSGLMAVEGRVVKLSTCTPPPARPKISR